MSVCALLPNNKTKLDHDFVIFRTRFKRVLKVLEFSKNHDVGKKINPCEGGEDRILV